MKILHDWDGQRKDQLKSFRKKEMAYLHTLIKLDRLVGVIPIIGIRDQLFLRFPRVANELRDKFGELDIRVHIHLGEDYTDPKRSRLWIPDLSQRVVETGRYDSDYARKGILTPLKDGELPIFHADDGF